MTGVWKFNRKSRTSLGQLFEIESRDRIPPMEGLRGLAVFLVFLQHYCVQFIADGHLTGLTGIIAGTLRNYGNHGVELFFVLSGFLIYGVLLRKRPAFLPFIGRRAQRLYPAFLTAFLIACLVDRIRPQPLIPGDTAGAVRYIIENLLFLPGLLPIVPISAVNWSLSYEWWFYVSCTTIFVTFGLSRCPAQWRIITIVGIGFILVMLSAGQIPNVPIRGLALLTGMLLAEAQRMKIPAANSWAAMAAVAGAFAVSLLPDAPPWLVSLSLAVSFALLCSSACFGAGALAKIFSIAPVRRLGNISYSFYLVHGFAVLAALHFVLGFTPVVEKNIVFWVALFPVFLIAFAFSSLLFLLIEKPLSLQVRVPKALAVDASVTERPLPTSTSESPVAYCSASFAEGPEQV